MAETSHRATALEGVVEISRRPHGDHRGRFLNVFRREDWSQLWGGDRPIEQVNLSHNPSPGTLRGLHLQRGAPPEVRLVTCVVGRVWDVAVDLRPGSATRGHWVAVDLSAEAGNSLLIPTGCAHGFQVLEPDSTLLYLHGAPYRPSEETGVRWDDPQLGIDWPMQPRDLSERDRSLPLLESLP
ncbi:MULTISPECIES: dTDP-4-dehydrorhamnose 3,5-epimerase [Synechococcales]|uniref:dTDP-4-dehydrorhamnose 3,5-epimerase family protein n=1 Tax=Synechococcales TaxID=1890424 RepID=UPI000B99A893|nr:MULTISPECIES: dTDP-4-dehydrorhamnose 3,5-epimerase [Synechococcales]MCP9933268.1 dTDP-4-dehydrorhamnose 3,5-epimerase family protein [Cyanobium sp. Candia 9D4]